MRRRRVQLLIASAAAGLMAGACSAAPPGSSPPPSPDEPGPVAWVVQDGVAVTLALERARLPGGERTWAVVTVENRSPRVIRYRGGGCDFLADVVLEIARPVAGAAGRDWQGLAGRFKRLGGGAIEPVGQAPLVERAFVDNQLLPCTADLGVNEMAPGERRQMEAAWLGEVGQTVPPPGVATIRAAFPYWGPKDGAADPFAPDAGTQPIVVELEAEIVDTGIRTISVNEAIDVALADPRFAAWLADAPFDQWQGVGVTARAGTYVVGLAVLADGTTLEGRLIVDRRSGRALSFESAPLGP